MEFYVRSQGGLYYLHVQLDALWEDGMGTGLMGLALTEERSTFPPKTEPEESVKSRITPSLSAG